MAVTTPCNNQKFLLLLDSILIIFFRQQQNFFPELARVSIEIKNQMKKSVNIMYITINLKDHN